MFQLNAAILYPMALAFGGEALVSVGFCLLKLEKKRKMESFYYFLLTFIIYFKLKRIEEFLLKEEKNETEAGLERRGSMVIADSKRMLNQ